MTQEKLSAAGVDAAQPAQPRVWVLADERPGNTTQALGLVLALGWPYEIKELRFLPTTPRRQRWLGVWDASLQRVDRSCSVALHPPWPDLVIAAGWRLAIVSRWIKKQSRGHTRLVQLGRKGSQVAGLFDVVVSCSYFHLPSHPRRIELVAPLSQAAPQQIAEARVRWQSLFAQIPRPHVVILVGGTTKRHRWNAEIASRLGKEVHEFAEGIGGSVFAVTSRRTGTEATAALQAALSGHQVHEWQPDQKENPYLAYLATADMLVVTGESESMLAEAAAMGKPTYIYPLDERPPHSLKARLKKRVVYHAYPPGWRENALSLPRWMLAWICQRLIDYGIVRPRRDLPEFHRSLVRRGFARFWGEPYTGEPQAPLREIETVAQRVREVLQERDGLRGSRR